MRNLAIALLCLLAGCAAGAAAKPHADDVGKLHLTNASTDLDDAAVRKPVWMDRDRPREA